MEGTDPVGGGDTGIRRGGTSAPDEVAESQSLSRPGNTRGAGRVENQNVGMAGYFEISVRFSLNPFDVTEGPMHGVRAEIVGEVMLKSGPVGPQLRTGEGSGKFHLD